MAKMKNRSIGSVSKLSKTTRKAVKSTKTRIQRNKAVVKSSKRNIDSESAAWYTVFTKGDKEYNEYMANEWGYERVRKKSSSKISRLKNNAQLQCSFSNK